jgi:hypothetical protein
MAKAHAIHHRERILRHFEPLLATQLNDQPLRIKTAPLADICNLLIISHIKSRRNEGPIPFTRSIDNQ